MVAATSSPLYHRPRMVRQSIKDILFTLNRYAAIPNLWIARAKYRTPKDPEGHYVHLGCGVHYIPGMINCDGNAFRKIEFWMDLRNPLPFADASACCVYCSHTLEHLFPDDAIYVLREIRRVLKPDGVARIAVPSFDFAIRRIMTGEKPCEFPRRFDDPTSQAINYIFCDGQHKYAYSWTMMEEFARRAGFTRIANISEPPDLPMTTYGKLQLGNEVEGSLVAELRV